MELTQKDHGTFREIYDNLPSRSAPKSEFIRRIATITMKSQKTVRCWLAGSQNPDLLTKSILEKELGVSGDILFPKNRKT